MRTQQRLDKFGLCNLRLYDASSLRIVHIQEGDIEQSPLLERSREAVKRRKVVGEEEEEEVIRMMADMAIEEVMNPNEVPGLVYFD